MITLSRRKLLGGLGLLIAAPAIVKASSLMPVKAYAAEHITGTEILARQQAAQRAYNVYWSRISKWRDDALRLDGEVFQYLASIAAEPLHAGQPVVLR